MSEIYAFLAVFTSQILAMSVLYPAWFVKYLRLQAANIPAERLAQLYPGVDLSLARERFLTRYRVLNMGIAVLGLLLLGWLLNYMRRPDWKIGTAEALVVVYFIVQGILPLALVVSHGVRFNKAHKRLMPDGKRKAVLQRRRLYDFVSPFVVYLAALSYLLFVVFVIYSQSRSYPGFSGLIYIGGITMVYALQASVIFAVLYGRKPNPLEANVSRLRTIGLVVKSCVYSCIACVMFLSLNFTLGLLDLQRWEPVALSGFLVITALLSLMGMNAAPHSPEAGQPVPRARDLHA